MPVGITVKAVWPCPPVAPGSPGRMTWAHPPNKAASAASIASAERFTGLPHIFQPTGRTLARRKFHRALQTAARLVLDWCWKGTGANEFSPLAARPDSEQLFRGPGALESNFLFTMYPKLLYGETCRHSAMRNRMYGVFGTPGSHCMKSAAPSASVLGGKKD